MNGGSGWELASVSQSSSIHKNNGVRRLADRINSCAGWRRPVAARTDGDAVSGDRSECTVPHIVVLLSVEQCLAGDD